MTHEERDLLLAISDSLIALSEPSRVVCVADLQEFKRLRSAFPDRSPDDQEKLFPEHLKIERWPEPAAPGNPFSWLRSLWK